jgi:group I intron endonuclease
MEALSLEQKFYVYQHVRPDTGEVFYVGKGCGKRAINFNNRGRYWDNVRNKAGGVIVEYVAEGLDEELSLLAEQECIDVYRMRGVRLTNVCEGGTGATGRKASEETKQRIGQANRHSPKARGEAHGMYGKKHTPEAIERMKQNRPSIKGEKHHFYGKHHSDDSRKKISEARRGKCAGEENPFYGKTHSPESIAKIVAKTKGRVVSEEERQMRSEVGLKAAVGAKYSKPVYCITNGKTYHCLSEAARNLCLHRQSIRMVCNGKLRQTGGYAFEWSQQ